MVFGLVRVRIIYEIMGLMVLLTTERVLLKLPLDLQHGLGILRQSFAEPDVLVNV